MYLLSPYLLLLSSFTLLGNASPAGPPTLPNLPNNISDLSDFLSTTNVTGPPDIPFEARPAEMETYIDDYLVKVGSKRPDSGQGDPVKITKALAAISEWYPSQAKPDGKYPASIEYVGSVEGVKYTFMAEEYRGVLDNETLPAIIEGCRRYAVYSKSAKLPTLHMLIFWRISFLASGLLTWEGAAS